LAKLPFSPFLILRRAFFLCLRPRARRAAACAGRRLADAPLDRDSVPHAANYTIGSNSGEKKVKKCGAGDFAAVEAMPAAGGREMMARMPEMQNAKCKMQNEESLSVKSVKSVVQFLRLRLAAWWPRSRFR
jgi:hypothetical protein